VSLASLSLDAGLTELRVSAIRRGSEVNLASELQHFDKLQHFDNFHATDCCVALFCSAIFFEPFVQKESLWACRWSRSVFALKSKERRDRLSNPSIC